MCANKICRFTQNAHEKMIQERFVNCRWVEKLKNEAIYAIFVEHSLCVLIEITANMDSDKEA